MTDLELCYMPGRRLQAMYREGSLSPVELVDTQIRRAQAVNPVVNAYTDSFFEEALAQARGAAARFKA